MSSIVRDWPTASTSASCVGQLATPVTTTTHPDRPTSKPPPSTITNVSTASAPSLSSTRPLNPPLMTPVDDKKERDEPPTSSAAKQNTTQASNTTTTSSPPLSPAHAAALAKPVSSYEKKARQIHYAMHDIHEKNYTFAETAAYYDYTLEELGAAFATFGVQAMEIIKARNVYQDTAYRTMALNKEGYSTDIENSLPKAFRQKKAEAEGRHLMAGTLRLPRVVSPPLFVQRGGLAGTDGPSSGLALRPATAAGFGAGKGAGYSEMERERERGKLPLPKLPGSKE